MPAYETSTERYRRLAEECLDAAKSFPRGEHQDGLLDGAGLAAIG
jgi:hypothetical protein